MKKPTAKQINDLMKETVYSIVEVYIYDNQDYDYLYQLCLEDVWFALDLDEDIITVEEFDSMVTFTTDDLELMYNDIVAERE